MLDYFRHHTSSVHHYFDILYPYQILLNMVNYFRIPYIIYFEISLPRKTLLNMVAYFRHHTSSVHRPHSELSVYNYHNIYGSWIFISFSWLWDDVCSSLCIGDQLYLHNYYICIYMYRKKKTLNLQHAGNEAWFYCFMGSGSIYNEQYSLFNFEYWFCHIIRKRGNTITIDSKSTYKNINICTYMLQCITEIWIMLISNFKSRIYKNLRDVDRYYG